MEVMVRRRGVVFFAFMGIIIGSFLLMALGNKFVLFPAEQTEIYVARTEMPRGTTLEKTKKCLPSFPKKLESRWETWQKYVTARAGISKTASI